MDCYSFTAVDFHHILLASLPAHSLALRPAHSRGHQVVTAIRRLQPFRYLHDCSDCFRLERIAGWALHPLESAAFSRRTPNPAVPETAMEPPNFDPNQTFSDMIYGCDVAATQP